MRILGVDPGLNRTGFGVVQVEGARCVLVAAGDIRPNPKAGLPLRLAKIHTELAAVADRYQPQVLVLEQAFTHARFPTAAQRMGHARGVICLLAQEKGISLAEYLPTRIKRALTGRGHATKDQVARMVQQWLGAFDPSWSSDATDALALAIAHAHMETNRAALARAA